MATKKTTGRLTKKKLETAKRVHLLIGILGTLWAVFGIFRLGFLGVFTANILRIFGGNAFVLFAILIIFFCIDYAVKPFIKPNTKTKKRRIRRVIGTSFTYVGLLILLHIQMFYTLKSNDPNILQVTWKALATDFGRAKVQMNVGGGMTGAILYSITHFLVANLGSLLIGSCLIVSGGMIFFNIGLREIQQFIQNYREKKVVSPEVAEKRALIKEEKKRQKEEKRKNKHLLKAEKEQARMEKKLQEITANKEELPLENQKTPTIQLSSLSTKKEMELEAYEAFSEEPVKREREATINKPVISLHSQQPHQDVQEELALDFEEEMTGQAPDYSSGELGEIMGEQEAEEARNHEISIGNLAIQELENPNYKLPQTTLLDEIPYVDQSDELDRANESLKKLEQTFESFKVAAKIVNAQIGPSVTKFEIKPEIGVPVSKFTKLQADIQLALGAKDLRMEAPIPGKSLIGIEIPNETISPVSYRDIAENMVPGKDDLLRVPIGKDIYGEIQTMDLRNLPHLLVAGATGSGKSVAVNGIITSILLHAKPHEVKLVMVDPKMVELSVYNGIPHLLTPVVTNPRKASQALNKVVEEMERRYELFAQFGIRKIGGYNAMVDIENAKLPRDRKPYAKMPLIVVIVDEVADLMMVAGKEVEGSIVRLGQKARAAGIHMILATQRPSVDVITGLIKANVPSRMAFAVSSGVDSRTILDIQGAEKLLGKGDMLFKPVDANHPKRMQGAFLSDQEVERIVSFVTTQQEAVYNENFDPGEISEKNGGNGFAETSGEVDYRYEEVKAHVLKTGKASKSEWQRGFKMNFNTATQIMDQLEAEGIVGPDEGKKPRRVLVKVETSYEETALLDEI